MLATAGRCADIHRLLECVKTNDENYVVYTDEIILAAVKELAKTPNNEVFRTIYIVITIMLSNCKYNCIYV